MLRCELADAPTAFTETPLFEVCSAKVGPRYFVLHQQFSRGDEAPSPRASPLRLESIECIVAAIRGPWDGSYSKYLVRVPSLSDPGILLTFAARVLIAVPCSVTTTASGDEVSMPTNTPGWNCVSHFPPPAGLAGTYKIFSPNSRIGVLSFRPCSGVFPSLPMSCSKFHYPAQYCVGRHPGPNAMFQRSFQCCGLTGHESHRTFDDTIGLAFSNWRSLWNSLATFLASLSCFPCQCFNRWLVVTSERDCVVPELINESRCSLRDPEELRSFPWNQHCPRHLVSPFADDQQEPTEMN